VVFFYWIELVAGVFITGGLIAGLFVARLFGIGFSAARMILAVRTRRVLL
jgi:hypothetical protein